MPFLDSISDGAVGTLLAGPGFTAGASNRDISYSDDFLEGGFKLDLGLLNETDPSSKFSAIANSGVWLVTFDVSPTIVIADGEVGGVLLITTGSNTDDFVSCQMNGEAWAARALKDLFFEIRMKLDDSNDTRWIVGLCSTDVTGTTVGPVLDSVGGAGSMIGFVQNTDTGQDIGCILQNGGTGTTTDSGIDVADDTFDVLGFHVKGSGSVEYFVNGASVAEVSTNMPVDDALTLTMEVHSPTASSTLEVDYISCVQIR